MLHQVKQTIQEDRKVQKYSKEVGRLWKEQHKPVLDNGVFYREGAFKRSGVMVHLIGKVLVF